MAVGQAPHYSYLLASADSPVKTARETILLGSEPSPEIRDFLAAASGSCGWREDRSMAIRRPSSTVMTNDQFGVAPAASEPAGLDHASLQTLARRSSAGVSGSLIQELSGVARTLRPDRGSGRRRRGDRRVGADAGHDTVLGGRKAHVLARTAVEPMRIEALLRPDPLLVDIEDSFRSGACPRSVDAAAPPRPHLEPEARALARKAGGRPGTVLRAAARGSLRPSVEDVIILRPVSRSFPDEPCFEIERWLN